MNNIYTILKQFFPKYIIKQIIIYTRSPYLIDIKSHAEYFRNRRLKIPNIDEFESGCSYRDIMLAMLSSSLSETFTETFRYDPSEPFVNLGKTAESKYECYLFEQHTYNNFVRFLNDMNYVIWVEYDWNDKEPNWKPPILRPYQPQ